MRSANTNFIPTRSNLSAACTVGTSLAAARSWPVREAGATNPNPLERILRSRPAVDGGVHGQLRSLWIREGVRMTAG